VHVTFGYVLARAAHGKTTLSLLDYGGGLGHYYRLARIFMPDVHIDFHCKEVQSIAKEGLALNPEIHWYSDDTFLRHDYDVVMINGSLQYVREWKDLLSRIASVTKEYLFLTRVPVVESANTYVAVQSVYGTRMLHCQFNRAELLETVTGTGLRTIREFVVGDRPYVKGAPEQPVLRGWLFFRDREKGA
jgi:putative methyltransferase (TIGR04325 family)